jgi:hypothetical protein
MTTAAVRAPRTRIVGRPGCRLSVRHSLRTEAAGALTLYGLYELARGLVVADTAEADAHAHRVVALERSLHLNHFFLDVAAGVLVAGLAAALAALLTPRPATARG